MYSWSLKNPIVEREPVTRGEGSQMELLVTFPLRSSSLSRSRGFWLLQRLGGEVIDGAEKARAGGGGSSFWGSWEGS